MTSISGHVNRSGLDILPVSVSGRGSISTEGTCLNHQMGRELTLARGENHPIDVVGDNDKTVHAIPDHRRGDIKRNPLRQIDATQAVHALPWQRRAVPPRSDHARSNRSTFGRAWVHGDCRRPAPLKHRGGARPRHRAAQTLEIELKICFRGPVARIHQKAFAPAAIDGRFGGGDRRVRRRQEDVALVFGSAPKSRSLDPGDQFGQRAPLPDADIAALQSARSATARQDAPAARVGPSREIDQCRGSSRKSYSSCSPLKYST